MKRHIFPSPIRGLFLLSAIALLLLFAACDQGSAAAPSPAATASAPRSGQSSPVAGVAALPTGTALPVALASPAAATPVPSQAVSTLEVATAPPTAAPSEPSPPAATPAPPQPTAVAEAATSVPAARATAPPVEARRRVTPSPTRRPATPSTQPQVIAGGLGSPDDLVVTSSGDILFGDFGNQAINVIPANSPAGTRPHALASGLHDPEGMVIAKDGAIIVADQATNRILEVNPQTGQTKLLRQLVNRTGQDGVDGLGLDPATGDILIPDSPNGRLLRMSRDGTSLQVIATGFVRPTGMAVEPAGTIVVADEFGNAIYRLRLNGTRVKLASIFQPDDIIVGPGGAIYVNSLGGEIARIDPATGKIHALATGLKLPHGIGLDPSGHLIIAEAGRNRILRLAAQ